MLLGDTGNYTVTLDLKQKDNAYRVWRAGITDDYDEQYVSILPSDIEVLDQSGEDVTGRFNVQVRDGVAYVYAKTVDTFVPKTGRTIPGDPQPEDLAAYASARSSCRTRSSRSRTATPSGTRPSRSPTTRRPRPTRCPTRSSRSTRPRT